MNNRLVFGKSEQPDSDKDHIITIRITRLAGR